MKKCIYFLTLFFVALALPLESFGKCSVDNNWKDGGWHWAASRANQDGNKGWGCNCKRDTENYDLVKKPYGTKNFYSQKWSKSKCTFPKFSMCGVSNASGFFVMFTGGLSLLADGRWSECMLYPDGKGWIHPNYSSKHPTDISTLDTGMSDQGWTWSCKKGTKYDSASNTCKFDPSTCKVPTGYPNANNTGCVICADLEPKGTKILSSDGKSCVADPAKCADANGQVIGGECEVCPPNFKTAGGNSCVIDPDQCKKPYKYIKTVAGVQSCVDCSEQGKIVNDALNDCQMDPATCKAPGAYMDGSTCRQCEPGKKAVTGRKGWGPLCMIPLPAGHGYIAPHTNATTEYCPTLAHGNGSVYQKIIEDICVKCGLQGYIKDSSQYLGDGFDSSKTNCAKLTVIDSLKFEACAQTSLDKKSFQECVMK